MILLEIQVQYVHTFQQKSDSGLEIDLLQKYIFVPLDIFRENVDNNGIKNKLDAWLTFLGMDEPEKIIELVERYPEFRAMYEHVYYICRNVEDIMGIFSEELRIMDQNTVKYMVDEMQEMIDEKDRQLEESKQCMKEMGQQIEEKDQKIEELKKELAKYR